MKLYEKVKHKNLITCQKIEVNMKEARVLMNTLPNLYPLDNVVSRTKLTED